MKTFRNNSLKFKEIDIDITDGISIRLKNEEYIKFINKLLPDMGLEIDKSLDRFQKAEKMTSDCRILTSRLLDIFYEHVGEEGLYRRDLNEINVDKLYKLIDEADELLGIN